MGETAGVVFSQLVLRATTDRLNEDGWDIEHVEFNAEDLQAEGVASGRLHIVRIQALDALRVIANAGDAVILAEERPSEFVMVAPKEIASCEDPDGARLSWTRRSSSSPTG